MPTLEIPVVEAKPLPVEVDPRTQGPTDAQFTEGIFRNRKDGEPYALAIHAPDIYLRTHSCKNTLHFWQGTEEQFTATFEKA